MLLSEVKLKGIKMNRDEIFDAIEKSGFHKELGKIAYEAFADKKEWKNYKGEPLHSFEDMPAHTKDGWIAFAYAITIGAPAAAAWDDYYKVASGDLTYSGQKHQWPYSRLLIENPKGTEGIIAAADAVKTASELSARPKSRFAL